jgi:hypothetical protein
VNQTPSLLSAYEITRRKGFLTCCIHFTEKHCPLMHLLVTEKTIKRGETKNNKIKLATNIANKVAHL